MVPLFPGLVAIETAFWAEVNKVYLNISVIDVVIIITTVTVVLGSLLYTSELFSILYNFQHSSCIIGVEIYCTFLTVNVVYYT